VIDRLDYGKSGAEPYTHLKNYHLFQLDIRNTGAVERIISKTDCVVHLAALVGEPLCNRDLEETWSVNFGGTYGIVKLVENHHTPLIFASTCSNYGMLEGWATEKTPLNPKGVYAETKVNAEKIISQVHPHVILRFATLYGVSPRMRMDLMLNEWTASMIHDKRVEVYQPEAYRPIVHVVDAARLVKAIIGGMNVAIDKTYNVGGYNLTKRQLAVIIQKETHGEIVVVDKGDPRSYRVSFNKIGEQFGFYPRITPTDGVHEVMEYLFLHPDAYNYGNVGK